MTSRRAQLGAPPQDEYRILRDADLGGYLAALPTAARLGGSPTDWSISELFFLRFFAIFLLFIGTACL